MAKNIAAIIAVFILAAVGWMILGATIMARTDTQDRHLREAVGDLWGTPLQQNSPVIQLLVSRDVTRDVWDEHVKGYVTKSETVVDRFPVELLQGKIQADLHLDQRQKGLLWYSTYQVHFTGNYVFQETSHRTGDIVVCFSFPAEKGLYDEFRFEIDGIKVPFRRAEANRVSATIPNTLSAQHTLTIGYVSQGLDTFIYRFADGISEVHDFTCVMTTDFNGFDFPSNTLSPTSKQHKSDGWELTWNYKDLITGNGIGVKMPLKLNPGPMASRISFFAPVSLGFFFFLLFIISILKNVEIHPINYFFLAAAFFTFHLLLAYLVDHISIHLA